MKNTGTIQICQEMRVYKLPGSEEWILAESCFSDITDLFVDTEFEHVDESEVKIN